MGMEPTQKRKPLTRRQFAELMLEQEGRCGCYKLPALGGVYADYPVCGRKLSVTEGIIDEHMLPREAGGSEDLSNRALLREPCAKWKTREPDNWLITHVRHNGGGRGSQQIKRERRKERTGSSSSIPARQDPWPQDRKLHNGAKIQGGRRMKSANRWPAKGTQKIPSRANPWGRQ